jgi:SAM-dependent methyltransferase
MDSPSSDAAFEGSIPELYERFMVPLVFEPYAEDLARRVAERQPGRVLETAAGTGVVTRLLSGQLPDADIVATDINPPMLQRAQEIGTSRPVTWQPADATQLPFEDNSFDVVVCQFGVMFFPDKVAAHSEAHRVLKPGGHLIFNTWDRLEDQDFCLTTQQAVCALFPDDPPLFMQRVPHGYFERAKILADVAAGGFTSQPTFDTITEHRQAASARVPAVAFCQGTPWNHELQARAAASTITLADMTRAAEAAIAQTFGEGLIEGKIQGHVVTVKK